MQRDISQVKPRLRTSKTRDSVEALDLNVANKNIRQFQERVRALPDIPL
jgi:hypothetical protein